MSASRTIKAYIQTKLGSAFTPSGLEVMKQRREASVDLIMTSPPFALTRKKDYGNKQEGAYLSWFRDFAEQFHRILKTDGSLVIDLGGAWKPGLPVRSLYHFQDFDHAL